MRASKQQQHQAEAALKQAQAEQAASDAQLKRDTLLQESATSRQKAELAVKEAVTAREQAEERAAQASAEEHPGDHQRSHKASSADRRRLPIKPSTSRKVKIEDLGKAIINAASVGGKKPTGMEVLIKLTRVPVERTGQAHKREHAARLVQQLGQQRMQQTGACGVRTAQRAVSRIGAVQGFQRQG
jgi:hypothetical protein